ncbi:MAG: Sapep family Mn(2+)-dependent dipeptidase [Erysipelotrichaceae bacterium]|nr:Sapep family Mn(2+)-dependent dipeptidase [Erysipelotrichaceae bacterium]
MNIKQEVLNRKEDIIRDLGQLVSYPSVYAEDEEGSPFGKANREVLEKALEIAESYGFKTANLDNYCGYVEMGQGEEVIGIVAHLDVVPVSESWATDPFTMTRIGDTFYGRGTTDDKGAAVCALNAMRILKDNGVTMNKRIRLILGCNEESGSRCIRHYVEKEGPVSCGFTPDGYFPLVYGEKGMVGGVFKGKSEHITGISGGIVSNAVAARCRFEIRGEIDEKKLDDYFRKSKVEYEFRDNVLTVIGRAAHASTPELGINAISHGFEALYQAGINDELVDAYHNLIGLGYNGEKLGIGFEDEYGKLTFNIGLASIKDGEIVCTIDIRFPVTMKKEEIIEPMKANGGKWIEVFRGSDSLFFPLDHPMIGAMLSAYYKVKGSDEEKPMTIGGGTYAKAMPNIVAFGCEYMDVDSHIHDDNEFVTLDSLLFQSEVYAEALLNLLEI